MDARELVDYAASLDCIHCGMCLSACPTYRLTGVESSSPRGRIHLMRAVAEGALEPDADFREEMEFCLLCRGCESVCPSGVRFGAMMEHTRSAIATSLPASLPARFARWIGFRLVLPSRLALRTVFAAGRAAQLLGLFRRSVPAIPPRSERRALPELTPARAPKHGDVSVLEGCVMPELYGRVNRATVDVLSACGLEVRSPREQGCCGSLHAHNGDLPFARELARRTIAAFERSPGAIVVNSAGCGAHMKDYAHLLRDDPAWRGRAETFAARVRDFSELVAAPENAARLRATLAEVDLGLVAYDDPCHLCHGQGVRKPPRALLDLVPGLRRVEMRDSESCCGSAGIYALVRPQDSAAVFATKLEALRECGARTLVTANPGCQMQWETGLARAGLDVRVLHVAEVLDAARALSASARRGTA
jgi:glycolate oxidase iron-sulfur subunit